MPKYIHGHHLANKDDRLQLDVSEIELIRPGAANGYPNKNSLGWTAKRGEYHILPIAGVGDGISCS